MRDDHDGDARYGVPAEEFVLTLVESGELEIDREGNVWRVGIRKGLKTGGSVVIPCKRYRAERVVDGYLQVRALIEGYRYNAGAHRLVWRYFNGPIPEGYTVNHKDGSKFNNHPDNLEPVTYSENAKHAHEMGLSNQRGEHNNACKLSDRDVEDIRLLYGSGEYTQEMIAANFGVTGAAVSQIVRGISRASGP